MNFLKKLFGDYSTKELKRIQPLLKKIGELARQDIEAFMGTRVFLQTWVKVKENWRDNLNYIRSFGYDEQ